jgi:broad specificity phosphatase PhoE
MKPQRIILIRHGKSEGNADKSHYKTVPDYALNLTPGGIEQAHAAGLEIKKLIGAESLYVYLSPYYRTRQTYQCIQESITSNVVKAIEDPRIREQDWGHLRGPDVNENVLIVTHGMTLRLFLMRWFHWTVEELENLRNPYNCQMVVMQQKPDKHYTLVTELAKRK